MIKQFFRYLLVTLFLMVTVSCVTETTGLTPQKSSDSAVVSVVSSDSSIPSGSVFSWTPEAVHFYRDERLDNESIQVLIEKELVKNLKQKEMVFLDSINGAKYAIAYTAALESSLDDSVIIRRYGLLPGVAQIPVGDENLEKGSLIVYVFEVKSNRVIWRAAAQAGVEFDMSMEERKKRIMTVVEKMFQTFPSK